VRTRLATTASDEPVTTSWHSAIYRGVALDGAGGSVDDAPSCPAPAAPLREQVEIPVAPEAAHVFTECAGIWNPIHSERRVALAAGFPDVLLHGSATWALVGREIVKLHADGDPARLRRLRARFKAPVFPGSAIRLLHGRSGHDVFFRVTNTAGEDAVTDGYAQLA
jgi:acyl dehydratase